MLANIKNIFQTHHNSYDFFVYLPTDTNKKRSFDNKYDTLKQFLNVMNDILTLYRLDISTFAAEFQIKLSTNN